MKNSIFIFIGLIALLNTSCEVELFSCLKAEGNIETRTINIDNITGIELSLEGNVIISEGDEQNIQITAHGNIIDRIVEDSKINGDTWEIDIDGCSNIESVNIAITLPLLEKASLRGSGSIRSNGIFKNIDKLDLEIDGDGEMNFKLDSVSKVDIEINGHGDIAVSGNTIDQSIDISGSGSVRSADLNSSTTNVEISGSGDCNILVQDILRLDLSGSGRVCYRGNPQIDIDISGSAQLVDCN